MTEANLPQTNPTQLSLQERCNQAHRLIQQISQLPFLLAEMQQGGALLAPNFLNLLQQLIPFHTLRIGFPPQEEKLRYWELSSNAPPEEKLLADVSLDTYDVLSHTNQYFGNSEQFPGDPSAFQGLLWENNSQSLLLQPLTFNEEWLGTLYLSSPAPNIYDETHLMASQLLAQNLAPVLAYQQLHHQHEQRISQQEVMLSDLGERPSQNEFDELQTELNELLEKHLQLRKEKDKLNKELEQERDGISQQQQLIEHQKQESEELRKRLDEYSEQSQQVLKLGESQRQSLLKTHKLFQKLYQQSQEQLTENEQEIVKQFEFLMDATSQLLPEARNLLNNLDSLQDPSFGNMNSRQKRFLRSAMRSNRYVVELLSELTDYGRCMSGQMELEKDTIQLAEIIESVHTEYLSLMRSKGIELKIDASQKLPPIEGDPRLYRQLFQSVFKHALDATPNNGRFLIQLRSSRSSVEVQIEHKCEPITEEESAKLFTPFQGPVFDLDEDLHSGISLSLVRELTLLHNGTIEAQPLEDGLRFQLMLPVMFDPPKQERNSALISLPALPKLPETWQQPFEAHVNFPSPELNLPTPPEVTYSATKPDAKSGTETDLESPLSQEEIDSITANIPADGDKDSPFLSATSTTEPANVSSGLVPKTSSKKPEKPTNPNLQWSGVTPPPLPPNASKEGPLSLIPPPLPLQNGASATKTPPKPMPLTAHSGGTSGGLRTRQMPSDLPENQLPPPLPQGGIRNIRPSQLENIKKAFVKVLHPQQDDEPQHLLYLTDPTNATKPGVLQAMESFDFRINPLTSMDLLQQMMTQDPATSLAYNFQREFPTRDTLLQYFNERKLPSLPLLEVHKKTSKRSQIRLGWNEFQSPPLSQEEWTDWLEAVRNANPSNQPSDILLIGMKSNEKQVAPLLHFCCGREYKVQFEDNPAQGIHHLYRNPPHLLLIHLNAPLDHWAPLFAEMSRSARTKEIPILLFSEKTLDNKLHQALASLQFILLQPT